MIDYAKITVCAGDGGQGSGSQMRIRGKRFAKADGGDGGAGGSVYFEASTDLNTLEPFRYVKNYQAENGQRGLSQKRKGAEGQDLIIKVPVGTVIEVKDLGPAVLHPTPTSSLRTNLETESNKLSDAAGARAGTPRTSPKSRIIFDLMAAGQKVLVARGGQGGRGNIHLRDEFGRRPKRGEDGTAGELLNLILELKLIADIGLIGLPNAGKSTLLSALTSAKPKVASYPFTTLEPQLGIWDSRMVGNWGKTKKFPTIQPTHRPVRLVIADIPGLIEGASQGKGLGDLFLRHIERTRTLVHLIDISQSKNVWSDYIGIRNELKAYSANLAKKKEIVVLNKIDLVDRQKLLLDMAVFRAKKKKVIAISAKERIGLEDLITSITSVFT